MQTNGRRQNRWCEPGARVLITLALVSALAGCGFHLRGTQGESLFLQQVNVVGAASELRLEVERLFAISGVEAVAGFDAGSYRLDLSEERLSRRGVSTGSSVSVAEYELQLQVLIGFESRQDVLIEDESLSIERIYRVDTESLVSSGEEERLLLREMRASLAAQILRRIDAVAKQERDAVPIPSEEQEAVEVEENIEGAAPVGLES